jgi:hypothetical protein
VYLLKAEIIMPLQAFPSGVIIRQPETLGHAQMPITLVNKNANAASRINANINRVDRRLLLRHLV